MDLAPGPRVYLGAGRQVCKVGSSIPIDYNSHVQKNMDFFFFCFCEAQCMLIIKSGVLAKESLGSANWGASGLTCA